MRTKPIHSWREAFSVYTRPRVIGMLFLGFSAGLPLLLIFGTLSVWLTRAGISRETVTLYSLAALAYSFKFVWSPLVEKLPIPILSHVLGKRRSWLLLAQLCITLSVLWMAMIDPAINPMLMGFAVVALGLSAATQDIVIDAYRIEAVKREYQAAMSATYIAGYRIGMLVSGFVALKMVGWIGQADIYEYSVWRTIYFTMAACMLVGMITTLLISEPDVERRETEFLNTVSDYAKFILLFGFFVCVFLISYIYINPGELLLDSSSVVVNFALGVIRIGIALLLALVSAYCLVLIRVVDSRMVWDTYIEPVVDFFNRYKKLAFLILLLIGFYRVSDIVLGVIANVFYIEIGFTEDDIAEIAKLYGLIMVILGGFIGGVLTTRFGVLRILLLGAILSAVTNLLFMYMAEIGNDVQFLKIVIAADNLSAGLAGAAFVAYLSSMTNISFTAIQYAIFSSLMTLIPKTIGGYSGTIVTATSYHTFFLITALLGVPVILLILYIMRHDSLNGTVSKE